MCVFVCYVQRAKPAKPEVSAATTATEDPTAESKTVAEDTTAESKTVAEDPTVESVTTVTAEAASVPSVKTDRQRQGGRHVSAEEIDVENAITTLLTKPTRRGRPRGN